MATPAPPVARPPANVSTNPRQNNKADYMVLSSTREPVGHAVYAADNKSKPAALHDIQMYGEVAKELDENSPVLQSILYSHRSVVNDGPTPDEILQTLDDSVHAWKSEQHAKAMALLEVHMTEARQEQVDQQKDLVRRDVEHNRALKRMEELINNMEKKIELDLSSDTGHLVDAWTELRQKHQTQNEQVVVSCRKIDNSEVEKQQTAWELERITQQSKSIISEAVMRSTLRSDEEMERISLSFLFHNTTVLRLVEGDYFIERRNVFAEEEVKRSQLHEKFIEQHRSVERHLSAKKAVSSLLHHTDASEKGMRFNIEVDEERTREVLVGELSKMKCVLDVVDHAMTPIKAPRNA